MAVQTGGMNAAPSSDVDVIIVNYNAGSMLRDCVAALMRQSFRNFRVILVDNGSRDGSIEALPALDERFETLLLGENAGFAKANNIGAAHGNAPWIATLNPDAYPEPDWLDNLLQAVRSHPAIVMAGSTQVDANQRHLLDGAGDIYAPSGFAWRGMWHHPLERAPGTGEVFGPCAAAALYRRDAFEAAGGFDEDFFCYHEDVDLAFRLRLAGGRAVQVREAVVYHEGSGISGMQSPFAIYHGTRNRSWTFFKDMPLPVLIFALPLHLGLSAGFLARSVFKGTFRPTRDGLISGWTGLPKMLAKRPAVQASRCISLGCLLRQFTWSPVKFLLRKADVRPWRP